VGRTTPKGIEVMDPTTIGVISAAAASLLTLATTKGVDAWLKIRADRRQDEVREETAEDANLKFVIGRQDARIDKLETELREVHLQHNDCEKKFAALSARMDRTERDVKAVEKEVKDQKQ
jgi:septal ring factor EnvC (AmiA/AmiB activator)